MFKKIIENTQKNVPLVHSITNYVTVNDCANIILAVGGSPIMADDEEEVCDITSICNSLVINTGTLNGRTMKAMILAGKKANSLGHPVVLDPVGAGASSLRNRFISELMKEVKFSVIRGNISEIKAVKSGMGNTKGVDADESELINENNIDEILKFAKTLSKETGAVICISGEIDIVAEEDKVCLIRNGHKKMTKITGSGCMLTAIIGAYCGANYNNIFESVVVAGCAMGYAGEVAYTTMKENSTGMASFKTYMIDCLSNMGAEILEGGAKFESR